MIFRKNRNHRGLSLMEIMITISIFILVAGAGIGSYYRYYKNALINTEVDNVLTLIKNTRFKALKNATASDYGVYLDQTADSLISFKNSYIPGNTENIILKLDQLHILNLSLNPSIGSTNTILFEKQTGKTANTGSFSVGENSFSYIININSQGVVD